MGPSRRILTAGLLAALAGLTMTAAIMPCARGPEANRETAEEAPRREETTWALDGSPPVSSTSMVKMTPEQVREMTGEYIAVNLWARTAHSAAAESPEDFPRMLFTKPSRECVKEHRSLLEVMPEPPVERLLACGEANASRAGAAGQKWSQLSPEEREARARRSVGLLFWSTDPPSLMSVMLAQRRGLDVSVRTNPDFARFAANYNTCEEEAGRLGEELAGEDQPTRMAEIWLRAERDLKACINTVTASIFKGREKNAD